MPESFWRDPLMYQGGGDWFLPPTADIFVADEKWGADFEGEVAVVLDDAPAGISPQDAPEKIALLMLVNDVSLRNLIPAELAKGFGFFQSKPPTAFSPVAVTPDELGAAWKDTRVCLPLMVWLNGKEFGRAEAGVDMVFNFARLVAHAAKTRPLRAGTIVGGGTVSNKDSSVGSSCIAEKRMLEIIADGEAKTPFLRDGDAVRIEMKDENVRKTGVYSRQPGRQQENLRVHFADENPPDRPPEPVRADGHHPDCSACSPQQPAHGARCGRRARLSPLRRIDGTEADALISPRDCVAVHNPPFHRRGISCSDRHGESDSSQQNRKQVKSPFSARQNRA